MSHLTTLIKRTPIITQSIRHYAPYLSIIRPFATATPSTSTKQSSTPPPSYGNINQTRPRSIDINQLNRLESKPQDESLVSALPQQQLQHGEDSGVDITPGEESSHLTFTDVPLSQVLSTKAKYGSSIHAVTDKDTIASAMEIIKLYGIGAVLVRSSDRPDDIVGIISTRDYIDKVSEGAHPTKSSVTDFMTESPVFAYADDKAIECLELMTKHNFRHLPVRERGKGKGSSGGGKVVGLVSIGDLVRIMLKQYKESNQFMKGYIDGTYH